MSIDDAVALAEKLRAFNRPLRKAEVAGLEGALPVLAAAGRLPGNDLSARTIYAKLTVIMFAALLRDDDSLFRPRYEHLGFGRA